MAWPHTFYHPYRCLQFSFEVNLRCSHDLTRKTKIRWFSLARQNLRQDMGQNVKSKATVRNLVRESKYISKNEKRSQTEKNVLLYDFNHWGIQYQPTLLGTADGLPLKLHGYEIFGLTFLR
jgi:hypothetical protein